MLENLFYHNSHELACRHPFGAVPCETEVSVSLWAGDAADVRQVFLRLWMEKEQREEVLELQPARRHLRQETGDGVFYTSTFTVPEQPGLLWYYFIVRTGEKEYFYGSNEGGGGLGILGESVPPSYQMTVYRRGLTIPAWFREGVIYQIFVDRYFNGNPDGKVSNPRHNSLLHARWDNTPYYIRDPQGRVVRWDFFGGNLAGVWKKLPYLKELGVSTIYFNPIFDSPSNHKYDTSNYHNIDPMFGDNPYFARLCEEAARMGFSIILDGVFSHTGSDSIYFNKEGNYNSPGAYQSKSSPYHSWYRFSNYPHEYESWWGIDTLPNVDEMDPSYREFIITGDNSVLRHWHRMGTKGWRLDVADELPGQFLQELHRELKMLDPGAVLIGEVWEDASNKSSYSERRDYLLGDELDSVTNYPLRRIMFDFILGHKDGPQTRQAVMNLYENYPLEQFYAAMNMTGSHDVPRLLNELAADIPHHHLPTAEQDALKEARLQLFVLWQMSFPGVPSVYYGDEAGMEGGKDPENRGAYPWGRENKGIQKFFQHMIALRNYYDVLRSGAWEPLDARDGAFAFLRFIEGERDPFGAEKLNNVAVVLLNRDRENEVHFDLDLGRFGGEKYVDPLDNYREIPLNEGRLQVVVPPLQGMLLLKDRWSANKEAQRVSGILLHPTSLPSPGGIGNLGAEAYSFVDFLEQSAQSYWQILPFNPPGAGNSPYQCFSAFAGDPLLIDLRRLVDEGLLQQAELDGLAELPAGVVDFDAVKGQKEEMLRLAFSRFKEDHSFHEFCREHAAWLNDFTIFMALKFHFEGKPWTGWDHDVAFREEEALTRYGILLTGEIAYYKFQQYIFFGQWLELKKYANDHGVQIIGDIPLFVAHDSSDVWSRPHLFKLDERGNPFAVAGVPPDYFSETGQLWGNPLYRWDVMQAEDYRWWKDRLGVLAGLVDLIRIDHFRGLEAYWEVPAGEETAVNGKWVPGPGEDLFNSIRQEMGELPLIAEDLGLITPEVKEMRQRVGIPGMNVLQFMVEGKGEQSALELPLFERDTVLYTGTHDNDTLLGWCRSVAAKQGEKKNENGVGTADLEGTREKEEITVQQEMVDEELCRHYISMAMDSDAFLVIIPLQDVLFLDSSARMNIPGTAEGNWRWRLKGDELTEEVSRDLRQLTEKYHRTKRVEATAAKA